VTAFALLNTNGPLALAIKSFGEYFNWGVTVEGVNQEPVPGVLRVDVVESPRIDAETMRTIERVRCGRDLPILLYAPPAPPGIIADMLCGLTNVLHVSSDTTTPRLIGQLSEFISELRRQTSFYLYVAKAETAFMAGNYQQAVIAAKEILSKTENPFAAHMILGRTLFKTERFSAALAHAKKASEIRPKSMAAASLLAAILKKEGNSEMAEGVLTQFLPLAETSIQYMLLLGDIYLENSKLPDAKRMYRMASDFDPQSKDAERGRLAIDVLEGDFQVAERIATTSLELFDLARYFNLLAISLVKNSQYKNAEKLYLNAAKLIGDNKENYKIYFNLGVCMKKARQYSLAVNYFQRCRSLAPKNFERALQQLINIETLQRNSKILA
jgi:Flp pilus assembly protein TadD